MYNNLHLRANVVWFSILSASAIRASPLIHLNNEPELHISYWWSRPEFLMRLAAIAGLVILGGIFAGI